MLSADSGYVLHQSNGRKLTYGSRMQKTCSVCVCLCVNRPTSSSVSHLLMSSVDWLSFSSSPWRRRKECDIISGGAEGGQHNIWNESTLPQQSWNIFTVNTVQVRSSHLSITRPKLGFHTIFLPTKFKVMSYSFQPDAPLAVCLHQLDIMCNVSYSGVCGVRFVVWCVALSCLLCILKLFACLGQGSLGEELL